MQTTHSNVYDAVWMVIFRMRVHSRGWRDILSQKQVPTTLEVTRSFGTSDSSHETDEAIKRSFGT